MRPRGRGAPGGRRRGSKGRWLDSGQQRISPGPRCPSSEAVLGALVWASPHGTPGQEGEEVTKAVRLAPPGRVALCRNPDLTAAPGAL